MSEIQKITERVKKFRADRDWDQFHSPKEDAIDLAVEAAEVLEHFQWKTGKAMEEYISTHKKDIAGELADVLYGLCALADSINVDLMQAFESKMAQNEKKYPVEKAKGNNKKYTEL